MIKLRKIFIISYFIFLIVDIFAIINSAFGVSTALLILFTSILLLFMIFLRMRLIKIIKNFGTSFKSYQEIIKTVKFYSNFFVIVYLIYILIGIIWYIYGLNNAITVSPEEFNYPLLVFDLLRTGHHLLKFPTLLFVQQLLNNFKKKENKENLVKLEKEEDVNI